MRAKSLMSFILIMWTVPALAQTTGTDPDSIPFAAPVHYDAGRLPHHIFCANLDGDSYPDIAVADWADANVSVLINNGDGTFQPKQDYPVTCGPYSVFPGDLDGDSDLDLALPNFCSNTISILKNNGDGTFQAKVDYDAGKSPVSIFCGDLDGDSDLDLAVANHDTHTVSILRNNGDGTF